MTRLTVAAAIGLALALPAQQKNDDLGFKDTPILPGLKWHVHDPDRPYSRVVTPGATPGAAPSDAIVLFDGKDLSKWAQRRDNQLVDPRWRVADGYLEVVPGTGDMITRGRFGDCQLHLEWSAPTEILGSSQSRGNSGVYLMSRYEIQVLDSYHNPTYADGQAGAIYGQWPPLVNPIRKPGEWNTYDIVFESPRFDGEKLVKDAFFTVFFNGVMVHNRKELNGPTDYRVARPYRRHEPEEPLLLQDHGGKVRYRNIWIRPVGGYDRP